MCSYIYDEDRQEKSTQTKHALQPQLLEELCESESEENILKIVSSSPLEQFIAEFNFTCEKDVERAEILVEIDDKFKQIDRGQIIWIDNLNNGNCQTIDIKSMTNSDEPQIVYHTSEQPSRNVVNQNNSVDTHVNSAEVRPINSSQMVENLDEPQLPYYPRNRSDWHYGAEEQYNSHVCNSRLNNNSINMENGIKPLNRNNTYDSNPAHGAKPMNSGQSKTYDYIDGRNMTYSDEPQASYYTRNQSNRHYGTEGNFNHMSDNIEQLNKNNVFVNNPVNRANRRVINSSGRCNFYYIDTENKMNPDESELPYYPCSQSNRRYEVEDAYEIDMGNGIKQLNQNNVLLNNPVYSAERRPINCSHSGNYDYIDVENMTNLHDPQMLRYQCNESYWDHGVNKTQYNSQIQNSMRNEIEQFSQNDLLASPYLQEIKPIKYCQANNIDTSIPTQRIRHTEHFREYVPSTIRNSNQNLNRNCYYEHQSMSNPRFSSFHQRSGKETSDQTEVEYNMQDQLVTDYNPFANARNCYYKQQLMSPRSFSSVCGRPRKKRDNQRMQVPTNQYCKLNQLRYNPQNYYKDIRHHGRTEKRFLTRHPYNQAECPARVQKYDYREPARPSVRRTNIKRLPIILLPKTQFRSNAYLLRKLIPNRVAQTLPMGFENRQSLITNNNRQTEFFTNSSDQGTQTNFPQVVQANNDKHKISKQSWLHNVQKINDLLMTNNNSRTEFFKNSSDQGTQTNFPQVVQTNNDKNRISEQSWLHRVQNINVSLMTNNNCQTELVTNSSEQGTQTNYPQVVQNNNDKNKNSQRFWFPSVLNTEANSPESSSSSSTLKASGHVTDETPLKSTLPDQSSQKPTTSPRLPAREMFARLLNQKGGRNPLIFMSDILRELSMISPTSSINKAATECFTPDPLHKSACSTQSPTSEILWQNKIFECSDTESDDSKKRINNIDQRCYRVNELEVQESRNCGQALCPIFENEDNVVVYDIDKGYVFEELTGRTKIDGVQVNSKKFVQVLLGKYSGLYEKVSHLENRHGELLIISYDKPESIADDALNEGANVASDNKLLLIESKEEEYYQYKIVSAKKGEKMIIQNCVIARRCSKEVELLYLNILLDENIRLHKSRFKDKCTGTL